MSFYTLSVSRDSHQQSGRGVKITLQHPTDNLLPKSPAFTPTLLSLISLSIYNRATTHATITQIYSLVGKKMYEATNLNAKTTVNLNEFYRGIYIFQLRDRTGKVIDSGSSSNTYLGIDFVIALHCSNINTSLADIFRQQQ